MHVNHHGESMSHYSIASLAVTILLAVSPFTNADGDASHCLRVSDTAYQTPIVNIDALAAQLNLSREQINKIHSIMNDVATPMVAMQEKLQDYRELQRKLHAATPIDNAALQAVGDKQARVLSDMLQLRSKIRTDIDAVLTPEQREQMRNLHHPTASQSQ